MSNRESKILCLTARHSHVPAPVFCVNLNQLSSERWYSDSTGPSARSLCRAAGLPFGESLCYEGYELPENLGGVTSSSQKGATTHEPLPFVPIPTDALPLIGRTVFYASIHR